MLKEIFASQADEKGIPYRPELTDRGGPLLVGQDGVAGRVKTPISQSEAARHIQSYGGRDSIDWLMAAVRMIAQTASNADYHFEDAGKRLITRDLPGQDPTLGKAPMMLAKLFEEPNPHMDWAELCELTFIDYLILGNAYWVKWQMNEQGQPLAFYRMAPHLVRIIPGKFGPAGYEYRLPGEKDYTVFPPEQVAHFKSANPHNPYLGLGIVQGGARALDMELALTDTMAAYYEKQALPSGVVQSERRVPRDVFNKLKQQIRAFYGGSKNAGSLMVLEAGLKYQTISPTAADALFVEGSRWSRDRILAMFHLNKCLLGIDDGDAAGSKIADAQRVFDTKTMRPLLNRFQRNVTHAVTDPGWGIDFVIDYEQQISAEDRLKLAGAIAALPGIKVKEIREIAGLDLSTGDKTIDDLVLNLPAENGGTGAPGDPTRAGAPQRNLPGQPGRPPNPENTLSFSQGAAASARAGGAQARTPRRPSEGKALTPEQTLAQVMDQIDAFARAREGKAQPVLETHGQTSEVIAPDDVNYQRRQAEVDAIAADMQRELLDAVHTLERSLLDSAEGKAEGTVYQRIRNSDAWKTFREKMAATMEKANIRLLSASTIHAGLTGYSADEIDYEAIAREIIYREDGVKAITETLRNEIGEKVLAIQRKGGDRNEIEQAVRESVDFWREGHAETIALTEAVHAYNEGTIQVAEANKLNLAVHDGHDHDEPCAEADGQVWSPAHARAHRLEHPRCRRGFGFTTADALV